MKGHLAAHAYDPRERPEGWRPFRYFSKLGQRLRGTLLITDRTLDMMAPFLHEFTLQVRRRSRVATAAPALASSRVPSPPPASSPVRSSRLL